MVRWKRGRQEQWGGEEIKTEWGTQGEARQASSKA